MVPWDFIHVLLSSKCSSSAWEHKKRNKNAEIQTSMAQMNNVSSEGRESERKKYKQHEAGHS